MEELKAVWGEFLMKMWEKFWEQDRVAFYKLLCETMKKLAAESDNKVDDVLVELVCKALGQEDE